MRRNRKNTQLQGLRWRRCKNTRRRLLVLLPTTTYYSFVRSRAIALMENDNTTVKMSLFDTIIHFANSHWSDNSRKNLNYNPFSTMETALLQSDYQPLTFEHHHLLLEEVMLLPVDSTFICAVSSNHYFLKQAQYTSIIKKWIEKSLTYHYF